MIQIMLKIASVGKSALPMKKIVILLFWMGVFLGCKPLLRAQATDPRIRFGLATGPEITTFINKPFAELLKGVTVFGWGLDLNARFRIGKHLGFQVSPGYTFRPYNAHRSFVGQGLDENGQPSIFNGKLIDRTLRAELHEMRLSVLFQCYFKSPTAGFHVGIGPELQWIQVRNFSLALLQDGQPLVTAATELFEMPMLLAAQATGGYTKVIAGNHLLSIDPYFKVCPIFTKNASFLFWNSTGVRASIWL